MSSIWCITASGITHIRVYFPMGRYTFPRVFPRGDIHVFVCTPSRVEFHTSACISSWGYTLILVYLRDMRIYTFFSVIPMRTFTDPSVFPSMRNYTRLAAVPHVVIHY